MNERKLMTNITGGCHCGAVKFQFESDLDQAQVCNCTFCVKRGAILHRVPIGALAIEGSGNLGTYGSRDFSEHRFCKRCGIQCFTQVDFNGTEFYNVNLRCVEGLDLESLEPELFDGANAL